jgi:membrane dipeptidase
MSKSPNESIDQRIKRLHSRGVIDLHFDLPMDLYEKRNQPDPLTAHYLPEFEAGDMGVIGAAVYIEDRYMPELALRVGLDQVSRLYAEVDKSDRFAICKTYNEIVKAREASRIALLITMEGAEPLGDDLNLLRVFYELGVRAICLTHARRNAAGSGGIFAPNGSPRDGLTAFGRDVVRECEKLGIILDLAHINPRFTPGWFDRVWTGRRSRMREARDHSGPGPHQSARFRRYRRYHHKATHRIAHQRPKIFRHRTKR